MSAKECPWVVMAVAGELDVDGSVARVTTYHKEFPGHDKELVALEAAKDFYRKGFNEEPARSGVAILPHFLDEADEDDDEDFLDDRDQGC